MSKDVLTQGQLRELLHYDPCTGVFTWLVKPAKRIKIGSIAGCYTAGYICIKLNCKIYYAHRLAWLYMTGKFPPEQIDHINRVKDDNRFVNLRCATRVENQRNKGLNVRNTSGFVGVWFNKGSQKWIAQIGYNGARKHLGAFHSPEAAHVARQAAVKIHHGEFACARQ